LGEKKINLNPWRGRESPKKGWGGKNCPFGGNALKEKGRIIKEGRGGHTKGRRNYPQRSFTGGHPDKELRGEGKIHGENKKELWMTVPSKKKG